MEIKRVLKPRGKVIFAEHGEAPDVNIAKWQARIKPGLECDRWWLPPESKKSDHSTRDPVFNFDVIEKGYLEGPRIATYNFRGIASIA